MNRKTIKIYRGKKYIGTLIIHFNKSGVVGANKFLQPKVMFLGVGYYYILGYTHYS